MRRAARHHASLFHGSCGTHWGYRLTCSQFEDFRRFYEDTCALCGVSEPRMAIDHDHAITWPANPVRGLLCLRCNSGTISHVDRGIHPIDGPVREYLAHPYRLGGIPLPYEPRVSVSLAELSPADLSEVKRLERLPFTCGIVRRTTEAGPRFDHPQIAACLEHGDIRPVMRLVWMWKHDLHTVDISDPTCGGLREPSRYGLRLYFSDEPLLWRRAEKEARRRGISVAALVELAVAASPDVQREMAAAAGQGGHVS